VAIVTLIKLTLYLACIINILKNALNCNCSLKTVC